MNPLEYIKTYGNLDQVIMLLKYKKFTDKQIIDTLEISRQTIYDARKRQKPLLEALSAPQTPLVSSVPKTAPYGNKDVWAITERFKDKFGTTKVTQSDRFAAHRLAKKYGTLEVLKLITALSGVMSEKYAPSINSVAQLDAKLPQVITFLQKQDTNVIRSL